MAFTYNLTTPNDITRVRYHIGDVVAEAAMYSDEEITFIIAESGGWEAAVIASIKGMLARLGHEPDMQADWLRIGWRASVEMWTKLLAEKKQEFGLGARSNSGGQHAWRPDLMKRAPEYADSE
jgi:hypothetical protein